MNSKLNRGGQRLIKVALWLVCSSAAVGAGLDTAPYPYLKALKPEGAVTRQIGRFELDEEMLAATDDGYNDVRVADDAGTEIPFLVRALRRTRIVTNEVDVAMETVSLQTLPDNRIEILLEKKRAEPTPSVVVLSSALRDFEKQVAVYGSDDRADWRTLAKDRLIFDYSRFMDVRNTRVEFEGRPFRYYKIAIANISETAQSPLTQIARDTRDGRVFSEVEQASFRRADFRIERAQFLERKAAEVKAEPVARAYTVLDLHQEENPEKKQTVVTFATPRAPLTSLSLKTATSNFSRSVLIEGSNDDMGGKAIWQPLVTATASRVELGTFRQDRTELGLSGVRRFRHYRLTISNLDSPPLAISGIEARGEIQEALFFIAGGRQYRTFYGARDMRKPRYDIDAVMASTETESADACSLEKEAANPAYKPEKARRFPESRTLLIGAIIAVVATLVWLMSKSLKTLDTRSE
jgi:hypothetical protein